MKQGKKWDLVVVGGGHAGIEAALIASRLNTSTLLVTMDPKAIGRINEPGRFDLLDSAPYRVLTPAPKRIEMFLPVSARAVFA